MIAYGAYKGAQKIGKLFARFAGCSEQRIEEIGHGVGALCGAGVASVTFDGVGLALCVAECLDREIENGKKHPSLKP